MTNDEMRIAIAESVGRGEWWCPQCKKTVSPYSLGYQNRHANCSESAQTIPNYPADLNAMHEVESSHILSDGSWSRYIYWLGCLTKANGQPSCTYEMMMVNATAHQRCEAYLRVKGLWKD